MFGKDTFAKIVAGLEKVFPRGPWSHSSIDLPGSKPEYRGESLSGCVHNFPNNIKVNADHLARCNPETMIAISTYVATLEAKLEVTLAEVERLREVLGTLYDDTEWVLEKAGVSLDKRICCNGHDCGCYGATSFIIFDQRPPLPSPRKNGRSTMPNKPTLAEQIKAAEWAASETDHPMSRALRAAAETLRASVWPATNDNFLENSNDESFA